MSQEQEQFYTLLNNILNVNNDVRAKAEEAYQELAVGTKLTYLLQEVGENGRGTPEVRQLAAVLLRRLISSEFEDYVAKLPTEQQVTLRSQLLQALQVASDPLLKRKVADATAELARNYLDEDGNNLWPEFLEFLFQYAKSSDSLNKEVSLQMFASIPGIFGNQQSQYLMVIGQMLWQCLQDPKEEVQVNAVKATTSFLVAHDKEHALHRQFSECLPLLIQVLSRTLESASDLSVIKSFIELAENCPKFLRSQLDVLLPLLIKVVGTSDMEENWRHMALEVIVSLAESAPAMMRKQASKYITQLVPHIFSLMMELDDDPNWARYDSEPSDDADDSSVFAESCLDRLACSLGGRVMLPIVTPLLQQLLESPQWQARHTGLMTISAIGEGCHKQMEPLLHTVVDTVLPFLHDPHPRVRHAACNALGQMGTDFAPTFEKKFHSKVIPGLVSLLDDKDHPRVQAHAGAALVNFFEESSRGILLPYLDGVASKLEAVLVARYQSLKPNGDNLLAEQIVVTLSSLAEVAADAFSSYYDKFMPCLKSIIETTSNSRELRLLRGKAIECASLLGLAVGKERFSADASAVMDLLLRTQSATEDIEPDDPQLAYLISSWARICKILGKQFEPYLPYVMGPVLKAASLKPEIALLDSEDVKEIDEDDDWQFVSLGESQNFGIRTAGLEEKATACRMLVCYARELKEGFAGYVEQVVRLMVPLLKFYFHDGVREAAAEALPHLLECAKSRGHAYVGEMWAYICPELLRAIEAEPEKEVLTEYISSLVQCIETLGKGFLTAEMMSQLLSILDKHLNEHFKRAAERAEKRKDAEDYDDVVEEGLKDEDEEDVYLLSKVTDVLRVLFATYKADFFPYFDTLLPHFIRLLGPDRPWSDHQWGLCVFDDVIEHGGPLCKKYEEYFLKPMLAGLRDPSEEVRQAAAYGIGVLGQFGGNEFAQTCAEAIPLLVAMISAPGSRDSTAAHATENAISAVAKILAYNSSQVRVEEILPLWVSWLPVHEDTEEAIFIYDFLCTLMEQNNPLVLGQDNCNLPHIVRAMAETLVRNADVLPSKAGVRMVALLRVLQANSQVFSVCLAALSSEQRSALEHALSSQPTTAVAPPSQ